jgi:membrane protein DedA with SNARE-associated domain
MDSNFFEHIVAWQSYSYIVLFLGMFIDANVTILASVFVAGVGQFKTSLLMGVVVAGALLEQLGWYGIGRFLAKKDFLAKWADRLVGRYDRHLLNRTFHSLLLSKFILGIHRATLVRCGMLKISLSEFLKASLPATAVWLLVVGILGLFFRSSYNILKNYIHYAGAILLALFLILVVIEFYISRRLKKEL